MKLKSREKNPELELANKYIFVKRYAEAERLIEDLIHTKEFRDDLLVHLRRIELATKLDTIKKLSADYERWIAEEPSSATAQVGRILTAEHGELEPVSDCIANLQVLLKTFGPNPAIYYGLAFAMEIESNWNRAKYNYEQCISCDPAWYPGYFGLSQVYYQLGDESKGDHYFFMFEEFAPYNVYGNFETHRRLSNDFLEDDDYDASLKAITTLSEWWYDNKGFVPTEIRIFEEFARSRISERQGDSSQSKTARDQARGLTKKLLNDQAVEDGVLYFVAKILEEYSDFALAIEVYKAILKKESKNSDVVQKIGGHFLSMGEFELAEEIFAEAYKFNPDNSEVRFCLLVARLRLHGVNVEEYLIGKERLKSLIDNPSERVELLSLLHSLVAMYPDDPDVQASMGDVYLRLGNKERATKHYDRVYELDGRSVKTRIRYASFKLQSNHFEDAKQVLEEMPDHLEDDIELSSEIIWLKANYEALQGHFDKALVLLNKILAIDPWNVSYLVQKIICLSSSLQDKLTIPPIGSVLKKLANNDESELNWTEYDELSNLISQANLTELAYERERLRFLYMEGRSDRLEILVNCAQRFDANKATNDFLKLLNTNFDCPDIYWALGMLFKELWLLETSRVWFEQMLLHPQINGRQKALAYTEIADCFIWSNMELAKALEYARLAIDLAPTPEPLMLRVLAHCLLKRGEVRQAEIYLEDVDTSQDVEGRYLKGLVNYRNGSFEKANKIWKPLLTVRTESLRFHNIKQELMKYYFDKKPYQGVH